MSSGDEMVRIKSPHEVALDMALHALAFYADPNNWHPKGQGEFFPVQTDGGDRARLCMRQVVDLFKDVPRDEDY